MPFTVSPLRYPGGKTQLYDLVKGIIGDNGMKGCRYIEPFAGGCGLALRLLKNGDVSRIVINDRDPAIYDFWCVAVKHSEKMCEMVEAAPLTIEEWRREKEIYNSPKSGKIERGFSALFLNRTNRSGIITADPIGGMGQDGHYKLGCRFNKPHLIEKIKWIGSMRDKIDVCGDDACKLIEDYSNDKNSFWFIDPPYYKKGSELYRNYYDQFGHRELAKCIKKSLNDSKWVLTYDACPEVSDIYAGTPYIYVSVNYSAQDKRKAREIMFFNNVVIQ